jgi:AbrB family looped-hinge helix DNA binding protein
MELVKVGKKGQVSIPKSILRKLGIEGDVFMVVETTPDGGIFLQQAGVYPLEIYNDERLKEFAEADQMSRDELLPLKRVSNGS